MAIVGIQTVNDIWLLSVDANPSLGGGIASPIGSIASMNDGGGFFIKSSALDTAWGQLATTENLFGANVLLVRKNPAQGQYATIEEANDAITTNSDTNRFLVDIGVGIFEENELMAKAYVSYKGASIQETIITPSGSHNLWQFTDVFSELSFMSLQSVPTGFSAVFCNDSGDYTQLHKVNFVDCDTNVKLVALTQDTVIYMEYCDVNGEMTYGTYQDGSSGFRAVINSENWYSFPTNNAFTASYLTGADAQLIINTAGVYGSSIIGYPPVTGNFGIVCQNGAEVVVDGAEISGFETAIQNNNTGSGCAVNITSASLNQNTTDINIEHPNTTGGFIGNATLSKVFIDTSSTFTPIFTEQSGGGGLIVVGNVYTGAKIAEVVEITTFIGAQGVGVILGGELTDGGTFDVDVATGVGYINDGTLRKLTWANDSITLSANQTKFIYYSNLGVLSSSNSMPDTIANLLLGKVVTNGSGIEFISEIPFTALWADNKSDYFQRGVFGSLYQSGSIVSENATPFKLNVTNGVYFYGTNEYDPTGGTAIEFDEFYQDGSGGWTIVSAQDTVPNTQYDDGSGTLQNLTALFYAKHLLLLVGEGVNEKYFLVYAQSQWATLGDAETADLPTVPVYFDENVVRVASIIIQQGAGNIIEILSERPLSTTQSSASAPVTSHLALTDLITGDAGHTQFLMLDGSTTMLGSLDMGSQNIINAGTVNGVTVETHASRHLPNGADPLTTDAPTSNLSGTSTNAEGIQNKMARSDHSHAIDGASFTRTNDTNVTVTLGGNSTTALLNAMSITLGWTGTLSATRGGTGFGSYAVGDLLYADTTTTLAKLADIATGNALISGGVSTAPSWGKIGLTTHVSGILPIANGGTNSSTTLNNNRIMVSSGSAIVEHSAQTSTRVSFYDTNGLPSGSASLIWNNTTSRLGVGIAPTNGKVHISGGSDIGLYCASASAIGAQITTAGNVNSLLIENTNAVTTPIEMMQFLSNGHTATNGAGMYTTYKDNSGTNGVQGQFGTIVTDITAGTMKSAFIWSTPNETNETIVERLRLASSGALTLTSPILGGYVTSNQLPNTANSNTISNTTTETNFTGTGITGTIPASSLKVGDRIKFTVWGIYSRAVASNFTVRLKIGSTTLLTTGARAMVASTNVGFRFESIITVRTLGASGTVSTDMMTLFQESTFVDGSIVPSNGTKTWDTTASQTLQYSGQFSVANAGNTMTIENASLEILRN